MNQIIITAHSFPGKFPSRPAKLFPFLPDKYSVDNLFVIKHSLRPVHGDAFGYWNNLSTRRVVLTTYELIKEASTKHEFSDR